MKSFFTILRSAGRITRRAFNRVWILVVITVILHFVAGVLYSMFEGKSYEDGQWWATVTASTVGYGDFFPVTEPGRFLGTWYMVAMLLLTAFITGHIVSAVIEDKNLFSNNEQERHEGALLLMGQHMGIFPKDLHELPSTEWYESHGFNADD